jgi:hypothetical protein
MTAQTAAAGTDNSREFDWQNYQRWAVGPLMTREQWEDLQDRIESGQPLPTNPYEW